MGIKSSGVRKGSKVREFEGSKSSKVREFGSSEVQKVRRFEGSGVRKFKKFEGSKRLRSLKRFVLAVYVDFLLVYFGVFVVKSSFYHQNTKNTKFQQREVLKTTFFCVNQ